tara:strand:+ start:1900 stop:2565 length:666 start_codon:yes stop_codon:yes gene_type:complete
MAFLAPMYAAMGVGATAATTAGVMGTAATTAMIGSSFVPMAMTTAGALGTTGGFFGGLASAYQTIKPFTSVLSGASSLLQGVGAYRQGQAMQSQYEMQALQTQAQNEINKLNWINDATERTRRLMAANASALAGGYARGVSGLDGSVKLLTTQNEQDYARDMQIAEFNQEASNNFASAEASLLRTAGKTAVTGSKFEALGYIGSAAKLFEESKVPTYGATS